MFNRHSSGIIPEINPGGCTNPGNPPRIPVGNKRGGKTIGKHATDGALAVAAVAAAAFIAKAIFSK